MAKAKKKPAKPKKPAPKSGNPWANRVGGNKNSHRGPQGGGPKSNRPTRRPGF